MGTLLLIILFLSGLLLTGCILYGFYTLCRCSKKDTEANNVTFDETTNNLLRHDGSAAQEQSLL